MGYLINAPLAQFDLPQKAAQAGWCAGNRHCFPVIAEFGNSIRMEAGGIGEELFKLKVAGFSSTPHRFKGGQGKALDFLLLGPQSLSLRLYRHGTIALMSLISKYSGI